MNEQAAIKGLFSYELIRNGKVIKKGEFPNMIVTVGKNEILDESLAGSAYTAACYMGLISSVDYSAIAAADTMTSHTGWKEAGTTNAPDYSGDRKTCVFAAASGGAKALSSALSFTFTETGTVKGAFIVFGSGASATKDNTGGILLSAALCTEGDRIVSASGDILNMSWTGTLT